MITVGKILTICQEDGSKVDTSFSKLYQTQSNWMELMVFRCLKNWNWDQKIFLFTWGIYKRSKHPCIEESCRWKAAWRQIRKVKTMQKKTYQNKEYVLQDCKVLNLNIKLWLKKASVLNVCCSDQSFWGDVRKIQVLKQPVGLVILVDTSAWLSFWLDGNYFMVYRT